jgi:hypothetical protein
LIKLPPLPRKVKALYQTNHLKLKKSLFSEAFLKEERMYTREDSKAAKRAKPATNWPVQMNG